MVSSPAFCNAAPDCALPRSPIWRSPRSVARNLETGDVVLAHRVGVLRVLRLLPRVVGPGDALLVEGRPTGGAGVAGPHLLALLAQLAGAAGDGRGAGGWP